MYVFFYTEPCTQFLQELRQREREAIIYNNQITLCIKMHFWVIGPLPFITLDKLRVWLYVQLKSPSAPLNNLHPVNLIVY